MKYTIVRTERPMDLSASWDGDVWGAVEPLRIVSARPEGSSHQPYTEAKLVYDRAGIYGLYQVQDRYVRVVRSGFQQSVCRDSCVEFFVQPAGGIGYFNLEMNGGGAILLYYVGDSTRVGNGFKSHVCLSDELLREIQIFHTLPSRVEPELTVPTTWRVGFFFPFAVMRHYCEFADPGAGTLWHCNCYKCADETSHPHWLSWNPVQETNFHRPVDFGVLEFA